MINRPHIFSIQYAIHYIDLILMDISKIHRVKQVVTTIQSIIKFIYNYTWVLSEKEAH